MCVFLGGGASEADWLAEATPINIKNFKYNEGLAGLIDGDSYFYTALKRNSIGCASTLHEDEADILHGVKDRFGGSINEVGKIDGKEVKALR